jgi:transposase
VAIILPDARGLSDDILEALRLRAMRGLELGFTESDVASLLGVRRETVCRWWAAYSASGPDALPGERTGRPEGSGRTLSDGQAARIQALIDGNAPEKLGIASPLWSRRAVRDLILKELGISMPVRTVGEYLRRWGYTAKRPRRHSKDQDPLEVRDWLEETYPSIEEQARKEDADILWCDETGVAADEHPRLGYAPRGGPATMEVPGPHIRVNMVSAIGNGGALRFMTYKGAMDAALFIVFLGRLIRTAGRKVLLIVDRLKVHDSAKVAAWVGAHKDEIELFYLPGHSPEMNPDEYLNNDLKSKVNEVGLPHDKDELRAHIQSFMRRLLNWPGHVASYFQHPDVQYAASS